MTVPDPTTDDERCECGARFEDISLAHLLNCLGVPNAEIVAENVCRRVEGRADLLAYPEVSVDRP